MQRRVSPSGSDPNYLAGSGLESPGPAPAPARPAPARPAAVQTRVAARRLGPQTSSALPLQTKKCARAPAVTEIGLPDLGYGTLSREKALASPLVKSHLLF